MSDSELQVERGTAVQAVLLLVTLVAFLDTFAMVPVLAPYAQQLGANEAQAGLIVGIYSLANMLASLGAGVLLDRLGRRVPLALSLMAAALLIALYGLVRSWGGLLLMRILHGASSAVFVPALFTLVGEHNASNRVWAMGRTGATIGLVALLAPPIGGIVADRWGEPALFLGIALLMALTGLMALLGLPESHRRPLHKTPVHPFRVLRQPPLTGEPPIVSVLLLTLGITFAMGMLTYRLPVMLETAGYNAAYRGRLFGLFALLSVLVMATVRRRAVLGGAFQRALAGVGLIMLGALALEAITLPYGAWSAVVLFGVGFGLCFPAVHLLAYESVESHLRGIALALLYAFYSLGYVLGPIGAGLLPANLPAGWMGALVAGFCLLMAFTLRERLKSDL